MKIVHTVLAQFLQRGQVKVEISGFDMEGFSAAMQQDTGDYGAIEDFSSPAGAGFLKAGAERIFSSCPSLSFSCNPAGFGI